MWIIWLKVKIVSNCQYFNLIKHLFDILIDEEIDFTKSTVKTAFLGDSISLSCNTSSIVVNSVIWVVTQNKIGLFQVEPSTRYNINNDGSLRISGLEIADEEYFACVYMDSNNDFVTRSTFFVFPKGFNNDFLLF